MKQGSLTLWVDFIYKIHRQTAQRHFRLLKRIKSSSGTWQRSQPELENQVGIMAHEYGHKLGLRDLYDLTYFDSNPSPEEYSAGIGFWLGING